MGALLLVEPDSELAGTIGTSLAEKCSVGWSWVPDVAAAAAYEDDEVRVVILGTGVPQDEALEFAAKTSAQRPDIGTVLIAPEVDTELLRLAMRNGICDVVTISDGDVSELATAVGAALGRSAVLRPAEKAPKSRRGTVVSVLSTKGGVGKSVIASNLAVALAEQKKEVVVVDLDLRAGDLGIMLQLKPVRTIADAAKDSERLDAEMLRGFLEKHSSGAEVLLAPAQPDDAVVVSAPRLSAIMDLLAQMFDVVIVDTAPLLDDCVLTAVDKSDLIYVVATMDVASVKDTRLALQRLRQLGYSNGSVKLVLNRADSSVWLEPAEVERAVGIPVYARIPSDRLVPRSVNKGVPVVLEAPRSGVAKSLVSMAQTIASAGGAS